jgi:glycosyltransferase involved in cell wall biosynthesis
VRFYNIPSECIAVSYLAVDHDTFYPLTCRDRELIRTKYNLPERYLLYAAALLPHKNHERLLKAFKEIKEEFPGWKLVFTGAWEKGQDRLVSSIKALGLEKDIILLGWLPFEDIPEIYRGAEIFVFPSLHEGFGLPILEAMASGVPVVCSRIEPLIEVAGNAAFFVDPYDPSDIARGILAVLKDEPLRIRLIDEGKKRAKEFTWDNTARKTLEFIMSCGKHCKS